MKKIISTLITLALLLNFAAFDVSAAPAKNTKRDSMLSALGILDEVYPDDYLTRDRYAEAIVSCFGYDKSNIDLATTLEFLGLYDDGDSNWAGHATFGEVSRGLVTLLGYDLEMKYGNATALDYFKKAHLLGITNGVNKEFGDKITEDEFAKMIYNCLDIPVMMAKYEDLSLKLKVYPDETFLSKRRDIYYAKGVITANEYSNLSGNAGCGIGNVQIGNVTYQVGDTDAAELLGYNVEYYYVNDDDDYTLLWVYADSAKNNEIFLKCDDIEEFNNGVYTYYLEKHTKKAKMDKGAAYIYNGKTVAFSDIPSFVPEVGDVTLIDYNSDSNYDVAIISDFIVDIADNFNSAENILTTKGRYAASYDFNEIENYVIYNSKFQKIKPSNIGTDNVLWIGKSLDGDLYTFYVSDEKVEGKVNSVSKDLYDKTVVEIDGKSYYMAASYIKAPTFSESGTFYLDFDGNVAQFDTYKAGYEIGWLINTYLDDYDKDILWVKMFVGEVQRFECSDKLTYNGEKNVNLNYIIDDLKDADGVTKPQLIRYKLNSDNKITYLQTTTDTYEEEDRLFVEGRIPKEGEGVGVLYKKKLGNLFSTYFSLDDKCRVFVIPSDKENYDKYVMGGPELFPDDGTIFGVTAYKLNSTDDSCVAAIYDKSVSAGGSAVAKQPSVIKSINEVITDNGEEGWEIKYYQISTAPATVTEKVCYTYNEEMINNAADILTAGDLVRLDVDAENNITGLVRVYGEVYEKQDDDTYVDKGERKIVHGQTIQFGADFRGNGGKISSKQNNSIKLATGGGYASYITSDLIMLDYCAIYICKTNSSGKVELRVGSKSDLSIGDFAYYTSRVGQDYRLVVYK